MLDMYMIEDGKLIKLDGSNTDQLLKWAAWHAKIENRRVERTELGGVSVSTVFLGMDHQFAMMGEDPVLWETMIFGGEFDQYIRRYTSEADARTGHAHAVNLATGRISEYTERQGEARVGGAHQGD